MTEAVADIERMKVDPAVEAEARQRLAAFRAGRDAAKVSEVRTRLEAAARGSENLMPLLVECVEQRLTVGEICHTLRGVWGEYRPSA
jgi:methylmalonyl-CoA mutase N-terminal domain/subunit